MLNNIDTDSVEQIGCIRAHAFIYHGMGGHSEEQGGDNVAEYMGEDDAL